MIKKIPVLVGCCALATAASSQDLLECVDPDVRAGLLEGTLDAGRVITRDVPEVVRDLALPSEFQFIGTAASELQTNVAYKTTLPPDAAMTAVASELERAGWQSMGGFGPLPGGFVSTARPVSSTFCRNDDSLFVMSRESTRGTFVNLTTVERGNVVCEAEASGFGPPATRLSMGVHRFMPTLTLPPDAQPATPRAMIGAFSGSSREGSTSMTIETSLPASDLADHFGQELEAQGWLLDGTWVARVTAGSTWTAVRDEDVRLSGLLDVMALGDSTYEATFRLTALD